MLTVDQKQIRQVFLSLVDFSRPATWRADEEPRRSGAA